MMKTPSNLKYSKSHEWLKMEDGLAVIGITDYAQDSLGDVVYVELPQVGDYVKEEGDFGAVESVKAASDLFSPLEGEIVEVNQDLEDAPELLNEDPYSHWIIKLKLTNPERIEVLLDAGQYDIFCESE
jgi:glycine cleavage system H protein